MAFHWEGLAQLSHCIRTLARGRHSVKDYFPRITRRSPRRRPRRPAPRGSSPRGGLPPAGRRPIEASACGAVCRIRAGWCASCTGVCAGLRQQVVCGALNKCPGLRPLRLRAARAPGPLRVVAIVLARIRFRRGRDGSAQRIGAEHVTGHRIHFRGLARGAVSSAACAGTTNALTATTTPNSAALIKPSRKRFMSVSFSQAQ